MRCQRDALVAAFVLFLVSAAANTVLFRNASSSRLDLLKDSLRSHARHAAETLDGVLHNQIATGQDTGGAEWAAEKAKLETIRKSYPLLLTLCTVRADAKGRLRIVLDTAPAKRADPPLGSLTTGASRILDNLRQGKTELLESGSPEGSTLKALAPLPRQSAEGFDFVLAEAGLSDVQSSLSIMRSAYHLSLGVSLALALIGGVAVYWLRMREILAHQLNPADDSFFRKMTAVLPGLFYQVRISPFGRIKLTYASDASRWVYELEPEDLRKDPGAIYRLIHPDEREYLKEKMLQAIRNSDMWREEFRVVLPKAGLRWRLGVAHVERLADGSSIWNGFVTDTTWRRSAEEKLRLNEQRLKLATQAGRVGTWDYDVAGRKLFWNDVMFTMKNVDPATFHPTLEGGEALIHPDDRPRVSTEFARCLASRETQYQIENRVLLPDGEILHTRTTAEIQRDENGAAVRCVGIEIDVTAEKRAIEAALAADRAKSEFLAMMSHEIRTPMNGVLGYTALLKETPLARDQREYVTTIESSGQHLLLLINDILDLSKIESGRIKIHASAFALRSFLEELFTLLRPRALERHLDYRLEIDPDVPEGILTDRTRLGQILTNILGNAVKFTETGSVSMHVHAAPDRSGESWTWFFEVRDTGCGINPRLREQIFEPFIQADLSATRRHGGTGLGLAISRRLARLLHGDILVSDNPDGPGSRFVARISAPISAVQESSSQPSDLPDGRFQGKKVLIVDDDPTGRKLCRLQLAKLGFDTTTAENGVEAVSLCEKQKFDVILMDVQMPGMDGFSATQAIRRMEKTRTPIIALTANAMPEDREKSLESGMDDYVTKPMKVPVLLQAIGRWI